MLGRLSELAIIIPRIIPINITISIASKLILTSPLFTLRHIDLFVLQRRVFLKLNYHKVGITCDVKADHLCFWDAAVGLGLSVVPEVL